MGAIGGSALLRQVTTGCNPVPMMASQLCVARKSMMCNAMLHALDTLSMSLSASNVRPMGSSLYIGEKSGKKSSDAIKDIEELRQYAAHDGQSSVLCVMHFKLTTVNEPILFRRPCCQSTKSPKQTLRSLACDTLNLCIYCAFHSCTMVLPE